MTTKWLTFQAKNRRDFVTSVDVGLLANGVRITDGTYEVSIRKLSKAEIARKKEEEESQAFCMARGCEDGGLGECKNCGAEMSRCNGGYSKRRIRAPRDLYSDGRLRRNARRHTL